MEPRVSMSGYVLFFVGSAGLFIASGYLGSTVFWLGVGLVAFGAVSLGRLYALTRGYQVPSHRRSLDRLVVVQWLVAGGAAIAFGASTRYAHYRPLASAPPFVHAIIVGALIISEAPWVS